MNDLDYVKSIALVTYDTSGLTGTYAALNGTGFEHDVSILVFYNGGSNGVTLSLDGVDDTHFLPSLSTLTLDLQANHLTNSAYSSGKKAARKGQIIYGKGTAGTGNLYISGFY